MCVIWGIGRPGSRVAKVKGCWTAFWWGVAHPWPLYPLASVPEAAPESTDRPCKYCGLVRARWGNDPDKDCPSYRRRLKRRVLIAGVCVVAVILGALAWIWLMQRIAAKGPTVTPPEDDYKIERGVSA